MTLRERETESGSISYVHQLCLALVACSWLPSPDTRVVLQSDQLALAGRVAKTGCGREPV